VLDGWMLIVAFFPRQPESWIRNYWTPYGHSGCKEESVAQPAALMAERDASAWSQHDNLEG